MCERRLRWHDDCHLLVHRHALLPAMIPGIPDYYSYSSAAHNQRSTVHTTGSMAASNRLRNCYLGCRSRVSCDCALCWLQVAQHQLQQRTLACSGKCRAAAMNSTSDKEPCIAEHGKQQAS
jgi:hypothetical protein